MPFKMEGIKIYEINNVINLEDLDEFKSRNHHSLKGYLLAINKRTGLLNLQIFNGLIANLRCSKQTKKKLVPYLNRFDVVIGAGLDYSLLISELVLEPNCKKVGWQHNTFDAYFEKRGRSGYGLFEYSKSCFKGLDKILVLTNSDKKVFDLKFGINTYVYYNPIPKIQPILSKLDNRNVLFVGRLDRYHKGLEFLIDIIRKVYDTNTDTSFTIVGDGQDSEWFREEIGKLKISNDVRIVGRTNNVYKYYSKASVLLQTSRFEGFGMTIVEAMSCGLPVVSFHNNGPDEIIRQGIDGYLVDKYDVDAFADYVNKILSNRELRDEFSENCIKRAKEFSIEELIEKFEQFLTG